MNPRQARRERREAERKAKKLELKKTRLAETQAIAAPEIYPEIQPRWNPELEDEFPREVQIRNNAMMDGRALQAGNPIPPAGPTPGPRSDASLEEVRGYCLAKRKAAAPNPPPAETDATGFVSQIPQTRAEINRANSKHSSGPHTSEGKSASSRNSIKHGLASGTVLIPGEDPAPFESFLNDLWEEHQPATPTEQLLLNEMAQSHWLTQRAIRLQNNCFTPDDVDGKQLALFLRYQTTHERRFYKALNTLLKLKKVGFVSQRSPRPSATAGFVSQPHTFTGQNEHFVSQNAPEPKPDPQKQAA